MELKGGNMEGDLNKNSRPDEEIGSGKDESKDKEEVTNMDGPDKNDNETIVLDHSESEIKQEKDRKDKEHVEESNHVKEHHDAANGDIEMKFVLDNKHLHTALSIPGSRSGTPTTARKRKNRHHEEMNMAEMISLSGVESMCTISNYDGMSTRGFDDDEEGGEEEEEVDKGIGVHHVLSVLLAMMSIAIVLLLYFLVPCPMEPANWSVQMEGIVSSSPVRLLDVNRDGMDDVIFGFSIGKSTDPPEVKAQLCENLNLSSSCSGGVIAMSGWRGEVLWRLDMNHTHINSLVCNQLDINKDGQLDCLAAGNDGLLMAINTKTGAILWEADPSVTIPAWTYSQPQTLPEDLDDDGVLDLVVSHGGNYENISDGTQGGDEVGRLLLLSGKTGQSLGSFYEMPDGHALVSPPIVFQASDDKDDRPYIVFGSGTVSGTPSGSPGSMWMVSLERLLCHVTGSDCITSTPSGELQETVKTGVSSIDDHVIELVRGTGDGFILPAIIADMTMDGVNDLIVVSHDALVTAINGSSFKPLWRIQLDVDSEYRPYSVPAPGHFNHDEIPDLMIQLGPHQSASNTTHAYKIVILDGLTGGELWHTLTESSFENQPTGARPSPLSLRAQREKDAFTFWIEHLPIKEVGTTTQSNIDGCFDLISKYPTLNLVMMDRDMAMDPPSLLSLRPYKPISTTPSSQPSSDITTSQPISVGASSHTTSPPAPEAASTMVVDVTPELGDLTSSSIPLNASSLSLLSSSTSSPQRLRRSSSQDCMMMEPILASTGIVDDFDDDSSLELIVAFNTMPTYLGSSGSPANQPQAYLTIQRVSLEQALDQNKRIKLVQADSFLSPSVENSTVSGNIFDHFDLLETKFQTWFGYLGTKADGRYT